MKLVPISSIAVDSGTQIRAAIDQQVVADYAEAMTNGAEFPPIVLFHDGNTHHVGDGFHRLMAAQRNAFRDIPADVRAGTQQDALWFALGANRANGKRLTDADKQHAIELAWSAWPDKLQREIAEQIGCAQSLVSRVYQKITGDISIPLVGQARKTMEKREAVKRLLQDGRPTEQIEKEIGVSRTRISEIRVELGMSNVPDKSRAAITERRTRMRVMASEGYTSRQIAAELGLSEEGCRATLRKEGIEVPGDKATRNSQRHDANRIVERMVMDAENLTADENLIDFSDLNRDTLTAWIDSLTASQKALGSFIRKLKEQQKHGQAA